MSDWPHQIRALDRIDAAIGRGQRKIAVTVPTGGGKTKIMLNAARGYLEMRKKVVIYTNRRMLLDQTSDVLMDAGLYHGVRAAGYEDERDHPFQVASIQTEYSRSVRGRKRDLHPADLVLVDEAHLQGGRTALAILQRHIDAGAVVIGFTATPLDLAGFYTHLIVAATMGDLRTSGAVVLARHFGPDEPDFRDFKKLSSNKDSLSISEKDARAAIMTPSIFGRVSTHFERLNPERKPTLLFAAGIEQSLWFAKQFTNKGIRAAHIDGDDIWVDEQWHKSDRDTRRQVLADAKAGRIVVLCNRFVLREGIDAPWLRHAIVATVFGNLQTYLQSIGRVLRADRDPETIARFGPKEFAVVQDHGGHWWRYGSVNDDREWFIEQTHDMAYGVRAERIRSGAKDQPFLCPKCGRAWTRGRTCQPAHGGCGYVLPAKAKFSRPVVGSDGTMREMTGDIFRARTVCRNPGKIDTWVSMYYRSLNVAKGRTFRAAATLFAMENNWLYPDPNWPLMPFFERDWWLNVRDVPVERLRGDSELLAKVRRFREKRGVGPIMT
jgi:superfamily II DNA or RNA helicase